MLKTLMFIAAAISYLFVIPVCLVQPAVIPLMTKQLLWLGCGILGLLQVHRAWKSWQEDKKRTKWTKNNKNKPDK